jgi:predicted ArsR family transcriptional regulator
MPADPSDIRAVALLDEPVRRRLYEIAASGPDPVSRDDAARAAGVSRALAAFHLDRLVDAGLLVTEFRRLSGRRGPGAGRPAKLYRRAADDIAVSLPDRQYELPARLFAEALERDADAHPRSRVAAAARALGTSVGSRARAEVGPRAPRERLHQALLSTLEERGYAPIETGDGEIRFANCPFHALVDEHRDLVCSMNLALAEGLLEGLGEDRLDARLDPQPGMCCVAIAVREQARHQARRNAKAAEDSSAGG